MPSKVFLVQCDLNWHFGIRKVVQASHHQGDIIRYGRDSAGKPCMANPYVAIIFSSIKVGLKSSENC